MVQKGSFAKFKGKQEEQLLQNWRGQVHQTTAIKQGKNLLCNLRMLNYFNNSLMHKFTKIAACTSYIKDI